MWLDWWLTPGSPAHAADTLSSGHLGGVYTNDNIVQKIYIQHITYNLLCLVLMSLRTVSNIFSTHNSIIHFVLFTSLWGAYEEPLDKTDLIKATCFYWCQIYLQVFCHTLKTIDFSWITPTERKCIAMSTVPNSLKTSKEMLKQSMFAIPLQGILVIKKSPINRRWVQNFLHSCD